MSAYVGMYPARPPAVIPSYSRNCLAEGARQGSALAGSDPVSFARCLGGAGPCPADQYR